MTTLQIIVAFLAIIFGVGYFVLEYKINKRRREQEKAFIALMNGRGPYPEDKP